MIRRFIGELEIRLHYYGRSSDNRAKYIGYILLPDGKCHNFTNLESRVGFDGTTAEAYDEMAESAVNFASYYTTHNRGDDLPDWAPSAELADAISDAAIGGMVEGGYKVRRTQTERADMVFAAEITTDTTYTIVVNRTQEVRDANVDVVCKSLGESVLSVRIATIDCEGPTEAIRRVRAGIWDYDEVPCDAS